MSDAVSESTLALDDVVTDPPLNAQAQSMFGEHHKEISRRSNLVESDALNPSSFTRSKEGGNDLPFRLPSQEWVLFSVSHVKMPPVSEDPRRPAVRLYGLFETAEEASDHARVVLQIDPSTNMQVSRVHEWVAMCATPEKLADDVAVRRHVTDVLESYADERREAERDFKDNVDRKRGGSGKSGREDEQIEEITKNAHEAAQELTKNDEKRELRRAIRLPRSAEVRDQSFVVVSFLSDNVQPLPEPLFKVYAAFNTQSEADVYVRNTAGEHVKDVDIFVASACEWLFPQNIDATKLTNEVYRSNELESVMANHKAQPQKVEQFTKWRDATEGQSSPTEPK